MSDKGVDLIVYLLLTLGASAIGWFKASKEKKAKNTPPEFHLPEEEHDDLDDEILTTVQKFFDNNLNVSETSRQLYVHRNTLVYRIEKLHQSTGLDIRKFDDALTFKIALMVVNYMKYIDSLE